MCYCHKFSLARNLSHLALPISTWVHSLKKKTRKFSWKKRTSAALKRRSPKSISGEQRTRPLNACRSFFFKCISKYLMAQWRFELMLPYLTFCAALGFQCFPLARSANEGSNTYAKKTWSTSKIIGRKMRVSCESTYSEARVSFQKTLITCLISCNKTLARQFFSVEVNHLLRMEKVKYTSTLRFKLLAGPKSFWHTTNAVSAWFIYQAHSVKPLKILPICKKIKLSKHLNSVFFLPVFVKQGKTPWQSKCLSRILLFPCVVRSPKLDS